MLKVSIIFLLVLVPSLGVSAEEPHQLSKEVQAFAREIGLPTKLLSEASSAAKYRSIARYVDILTAADVMAIERAKAQKRETPTKDDYAAVFAAICLLPNKPPVNEKLSSFITKDIRLGFSESYISEKKRFSIKKSMGPELLKGNLNVILIDMSKPSFNSSTYIKNILDIKGFDSKSESFPELKK